MIKKGNSDSLIESYWRTRIMIPLFLLIFSLLASLPFVYRKVFVDSYYILSDKRSYIDKYESIIDKTKIKDIYSKSTIRRVYCKDGFLTYLIDVNSVKSIYGKLNISQIKVGDTIYKNRNSNIFFILKNGKEYTFKIDANRNEKGELVKSLSFKERLYNIFPKFAER